jgi:predicted glycosyltransferase
VSAALTVVSANGYNTACGYNAGLDLSEQFL